MAGKDIIMMSKRELKRSHIIHRVLDKELKQVSAAEFLDLTPFGRTCRGRIYLTRRA